MYRQMSGINYSDPANYFAFICDQNRIYNKRFNTMFILSGAYDYTLTFITFFLHETGNI